MPDTYNVPHAGMYNVAPAMPAYNPPVNPPAYEPPAVDPATLSAMINQGDAYEPSPDMYNDNHRAFENAVATYGPDAVMTLAQAMFPALRPAINIARGANAWRNLRSKPIEYRGATYVQERPLGYYDPRSEFGNDAIYQISEGDSRPVIKSFEAPYTNYSGITLTPKEALNRGLATGTYAEKGAFERDFARLKAIENAVRERAGLGPEVPYDEIWHQIYKHDPYYRPSGGLIQDMYEGYPYLLEQK